MRRVLAVLLVLLGAGCADASDPGGDPVVGDVTPALVERALAYEAPQSYVLELDVACFCPVSRFRLEVLNQAVIDVVALDDDGIPVEGDSRSAFAISIAALQQRLRDTWEGDGDVTALEVDPDGLPRVVGLDPLPDAVDDEITYRVRSLEPTEASS